MLRGWLLRGSTCAAPSARSTSSSLIAPSPRLLHSTTSSSTSSSFPLPLPFASSLTQQHQQPRRPHVACMAGLEIGRRYAKPANYKPATSFRELQLDERLVEALAAAKLDTPTEIQSLAIPAILQGGDHLLAAQTGSGKTLAYLLPLITLLKAQEGQPGMERRGKRPKIVVLVPTKELVEQITSVAKTLCHYAKFRVVPCSANYNENIQSRSLTAPLEVLVATPTRLKQVLDHGRVALGDVRWLVIDEADTMLESGKGFQAEVSHLLNILKAKSPPAQTLLVSATMTTQVKQLVRGFLPDLTRIEAEGFHRPAAGATHDFRPLEPGGDKMQLLLEVLQSDVAKGRKVLVFCNSMGSCRAVEHTVRERDMPTVCYHGDMPIQARKDAMAQFAGNYAEGEEGHTGGATVMVATDLAARGLDFPGTIDHVINFDMPGNAIDYLHRSGRTARGGAKGRVTSLLQSRTDRNMAKAIQYALDKGIGLDQVTASGAAAVAVQQQQQQQQSSRWEPPKRERRAKGPAPISGAKQVVAWNPNHKFIHISSQSGEPLVPFKQLLKGKSGDERRRLLWEIAMDVKEWRRWRHAKAVDKSHKKREKGARELDDRLKQMGQAAGPKPKDPEERWKWKMAQKQGVRYKGSSDPAGGSSSRGKSGGGGSGSTKGGQRRLFKGQR